MISALLIVAMVPAGDSTPACEIDANLPGVTAKVMSCQAAGSASCVDAHKRATWAQSRAEVKVFACCEAVRQ